MEESFLTLLQNYVHTLEAENNNNQDVINSRSNSGTELVPWRDVVQFMSMCQSALVANRNSAARAVRKNSDEESAFMADQVESLLAEKHNLQEQITSLKRDKLYLEERNDYLQQQLLERASSTHSLSEEDLIGQKLQQELDIQRVVNAQLQREVEHLRQRLLEQSPPPLLPLPARFTGNESDKSASPDLPVAKIHVATTTEAHDVEK